MAKRRGYIPKDELTAAALRIAFDIPWEHARALTAEQIISLVVWDHGIYKTWEENPGEFDKHWNLTPRLIKANREKTKTDIKIIAKSRRISKAHEEFRARLLALSGLANENPLYARLRAKKKIPSRPLPKGKRKMRSRSSFQRVRRSSLLASEGVKR